MASVRLTLLVIRWIGAALGVTSQCFASGSKAFLNGLLLQAALPAVHFRRKPSRNTETRQRPTLPKPNQFWWQNPRTAQFQTRGRGRQLAAILAEPVKPARPHVSTRHPDTLPTVRRSRPLNACWRTGSENSIRLLLIEPRHELPPNWPPADARLRDQNVWNDWVGRWSGMRHRQGVLRAGLTPERRRRTGMLNGMVEQTGFCAGRYGFGLGER
jgi:hypothetical protein